jgi:signal transduction histidine kinase
MVIFLVLYEPVKEFVLPLQSVLICLVFGIFNLYLIFVSERKIYSEKFMSSIFLIDVIFISSIIYLTRGIDTDLYIAYFLVIFMSALASNLKISVIIAFLAFIFYFGMLVKDSGQVDLLNPGLLLRIPFLFIVAIVSGYFGEETKKQELHRKHIENLFREAKNQLYRSTQMASIGKLIGTIVHEMKTPLEIISSKGKYLLDNIKRALSTEDLEKNIGDIYDMTSHGNEIVEEILNFTKQDYSQVGKIDINRTMDETLTLMSYQFIEKGIILSKQLDEGSLIVSGNKGQFQQVFINLINNALDALSKGGRLSVETRSDDKWVIVEFKDNGPGIPQMEKSKIFEPFFSTKGEPGLGLTISKDIINNYHGKIELETEEGKGTTFVIYLPKAS